MAKDLEETGLVRFVGKCLTRRFSSFSVLQNYTLVKATYIYIYIHVYVYTYVCIYIHNYTHQTYQNIYNLQNPQKHPKLSGLLRLPPLGLGGVVLDFFF